MKVKNLIIGCGIGGLSAAAAFKEAGEEDFLIIDRCSEVPLNLHNGVHYLHTDNFGTPFKFELKEIVSTEEIWNPRKDEFKNQSHIPEMVDYSLKVMNLRHPSSIMDPGSRNWKTYIPASNNMNDLVVSYKEYIGAEKFKFNEKLRDVGRINKIAIFESGLTVEYENLISTAPLNLFYFICAMDTEKEFKHQTVYITNYKTDRIVPNWLICLYIADNKFPVYRITVLNNIISMESLTKLTVAEEHIIKYHLERYFDYELDSREAYAWETGRIWGLSKSEKEEIVEEFKQHNIYLLGRYGTWNGKETMDTTILAAKEIVKEIIK